MRTPKEIENVLMNLPELGRTKDHSMTYEQGIEDALLWVLGGIYGLFEASPSGRITRASGIETTLDVNTDDEFDYAPKKK